MLQRWNENFSSLVYEYIFVVYMSILYHLNAYINRTTRSWIHELQNGKHMDRTGEKPLLNNGMKFGAFRTPSINYMTRIEQNLQLQKFTYCDGWLSTCEIMMNHHEIVIMNSLRRSACSFITSLNYTQKRNRK